MTTSDPQGSARTQLRDVGRRIQHAEGELEMLHVLRDQRILDAQRRGLSQAEIGRLLGGLTKQRIGQIVKELRAQMLEAMR